jgi:hypothetical protein
MTTRKTRDDPWDTPVNLGPSINTSYYEAVASISTDGLELYFVSNQPAGIGQGDLYVSKRATKNDEWAPAENLGPTINSSSDEADPFITADGLMLFFSANLAGGFGDRDLYMVRRPTKNDPWGLPQNLGPKVNTAYGESGPCTSADGCWLYFIDYPTRRLGGEGNLDLWHVPIIPIVDLNGDGIVDVADMCIMIDNWGTDEPLCDIGPMPWGDGIVDVQDLIVLAEHLFEEVPPVE